MAHARWLRLVLLAALVVASSLSLVLGDDHSHEYADGEEVTLWYNKVGPYHNPQETYAYQSLPWCVPTAAKDHKVKSHSLGVILEGDQLTDSGLAVTFKSQQTHTHTRANGVDGGHAAGRSECDATGHETKDS